MVNRRGEITICSVAVTIALLVLFNYYSANSRHAYAHSSTPNVQEDSLVVVASPTSVNREHNVTITATVFAHRTGGSASTNWNIQLTVPSGYSIASGANPQTKTTTSHGTAMASWVVVAPPLPSGPDTFTVDATATDGTLGTALSGSPDVDSFTITTVNRNPTAYDDSISIAEDADPITINVLTNDTDADNDTLLITSISSEPINGTAEISDSNTTITYTPHANFFGTDSITYTIEDEYGGPASGTITIMVSPVNDAPAAVTDSYEIDEDTLLTGTGIGVITNDTDIENDTLSATLVQDTANGTLALYSNGSFTYLPNIDFNGLDTFSYLANDGDLDSNNTATVNITVSAVNDLPIANNATVSVDEDGQLAITLEGSDVDRDDLTFVITTNPANGTLAGLNASSGIVTYIPLADFNGQDSFGYRISDGSANSTYAIVTIVINPVEEPRDDRDDERDGSKNNDKRDYDEEELAAKRLTYEDSHFDDRPLERVQIQSHDIVNTDGAAFASSEKGEKVTLSYAFRNYQQKIQPYYFIVQIVDDNDMTIGLQFVSGELAKGEIAVIEQTWTPENAGAYSIKVFIWDDLEMPSPLTDVETSTLRVR